MRPIEKLAIPKTEFSSPIDGVLMNHLGTHCSICERPMPDQAWVWNQDTGKTIKGKSNQADWPHLLLLCHNCHDSQKTAPQELRPHLLLPDKDLTFRLDDKAELVYTLQPVSLVYLDDQGNPETAPNNVELVIVRACSPAAQATIDYFGLNTHYYNQNDNSFRIPKKDYLSMVDRRVDLRTEAWHNAQQYADYLKETDTELLINAFLQQARIIIQSGGFWSTWATVMWQSFHDKTLLEKLLLPRVEEEKPKKVNRLKATPMAAVTTSDSDKAKASIPTRNNTMPGTSRKWLL
jgi:hypothetical protein